MRDFRPHVGYVSTYPPRACGIATYTRDLARALMMRDQIGRYLVVAINEENGNQYSDPRVNFTIAQHERPNYLTAADFLNQSNVDVVNIQHEFGIFGGEWGEYVLDLCGNIEKPMITTFHTVLRNPPDKARRIMAELVELSEAVIVTIESAARLLKKYVGLNSEKVRVVRHGAALPERGRNEYAKRFLGLQKRTVLTTLGLISSGKGIEYAIKSLPYLVKERPDLLYLVIGETHPEVRRHEGEAYRENLTSLTNRLHLEGNVHFVDRYLPEDELSMYLQAVDIYVAPYLGKDQVSSGTLTLALGHGKAIVSTPTLFAKEELSNNRGLFCKFADARSIAECVERILGDSKLRLQLETNAYKYGQGVGWTKVAEQYGDILRSAIRIPRTIDETATISEA
jgi:glycosyltransferase involved in cell wall biosynthesis